MRKILAIILTSICIGTVSFQADAQLFEKAENLIRTALRESAPDSVSTVQAVEERVKQDSMRMREMELELQEMKLNEIAMRAEIENARSRTHGIDSAEIVRRIDSLRLVTPGVPVVVESDTLFLLYANSGGYSPFDRAEIISNSFAKVIKDKSHKNDSVYIVDNDGFVDIMCGDKVLVSISDHDALWQGTDRHSLAQSYLPVVQAKINGIRKGHTILGFITRAGLFILVIVAQYLLFKLTNYLFRKLRRHIIKFRNQRLKPVYIRDYELLNKKQLGRIIIFCSNIVRYIILLIQLTFSVPLLFAIFPQTEKLALNIFLYILAPVRMVLNAIINYIPNLFIIIVIWLCIRYLVKGLRYIAKEIENEKLKIHGFYPDWAQPTFNIIRFLLYAFMIAMIYPYLPGSDSGVFQGISVFVGLIVSLGSSTVIGNIIAGLVITYMRPFKLGDRIKLNDTTGNVIEKTPFVTRLRTPKNEVVTIPNSFIMSSHTVNYSASARQFGLIINTTVTIGYDVPWRQVHQLLINAARMTPGVLEEPKPFVLETDLQDYYPCYQINAYINDADLQAVIMTDLLQNIQDTFNEAGVEIMSPQYIATRDGNASTIPTDPMKD